MAVGTIGAIALGVAGASSVGGIVKGRKAAKAQRRANDAQRKINQLKNRQAKRQFMRGFRQAQAVNLVQGIASGVGLESSRTQGTRSSQNAQALTAFGEFNIMDRLGGEMTRQMNRASKYQYQAGVFGQISSFALSFAAMSAGAPGETPGSTGPIGRGN